MSAVVQEKQVETIFDHDITDDEQIALFDFIETPDDYLFSMPQNNAWADIYSLYQIRGNVKKAESYLNKITNPRLVDDLIRVSCCGNEIHSRLLPEKHSNLLNANK